MTPREYWIESTQRIALPVLSHLANGTLHQNMPVETLGDASRRQFTHLEAIGRLLSGIAPWLELREKESAPLLQLAHRALDSASDPTSPDYCNFTEGQQPVVDAAFLAQGILRAPKTLWEPLEPRVQQNLIDALKASRRIIPAPCNWLLFSAIIEAALFRTGAKDWDGMRVTYALRQHEQWYKGDGLYGDGASFHMDYYNSFVIQPMMLDIIHHLKSEIPELEKMEESVLLRSRRYAAILERMISPEGTFPPLGRSLSYRFGSLQSLAQMSLLRRLPEEIHPAQVREAMTAVLRRFMNGNIFDQEGWLKVGLIGGQIGLGERYISTGSLYLFACGLLPLGLAAGDPFWSDPAQPWTSVKAWGGRETPIDHAIHL